MADINLGQVKIKQKKEIINMYTIIEKEFKSPHGRNIETKHVTEKELGYKLNYYSNHAIYEQLSDRIVNTVYNIPVFFWYKE